MLLLLLTINAAGATGRGEGTPPCLPSCQTLFKTYSSVAERIIGQPLSVPDRPLESMMAVLGDEFDLVR